MDIFINDFDPLVQEALNETTGKKVREYPRKNNPKTN
jgi:hypothetical protein